jgi:hypothetical protein
MLFQDSYLYLKPKTKIARWRGNGQFSGATGALFYTDVFS